MDVKERIRYNFLRLMFREFKTTPPEFAKKIGYESSYVYQLMNGDSAIGPKPRKRICERCDLSEDEFMVYISGDLKAELDEEKEKHKRKRGFAENVKIDA